MLFQIHLLSLTPLSASLTQAVSNLTPDYEATLLMNPSAVLGTDHKLTPAVLSTFSMPTSVTKMNVQFLDTDPKTTYNANWSPRMRKTENESGFELTYKKRYNITNSDIDAALTTARNEGFDSGDTNYEAQVEWGYQNKPCRFRGRKREAIPVTVLKTSPPKAQVKL